MIYREEKANYFSLAIWTTQITLNGPVKFVSTRKAFYGVSDDREWFPRLKRRLICPSGQTPTRSMSATAKPDNCISEIGPNQRYAGRTKPTRLIKMKYAPFAV